jgi:hypothetical protein
MSEVREAAVLAYADQSLREPRRWVRRALVVLLAVAVPAGCSGGGFGGSTLGRRRRWRR